ncbi:MAG: helix-turn-helix domain-containing protein [Dehalococcoidia bacterium]|nr:helix-turn-helix domain-containing protein [Dehalococcoidia bacterium]
MMMQLYDRRETGGRIRELRASMRMTQSELAFYSGITQSALSNYENGRRDVPLPVLVAMAGALKVRPTELVPGLQELPPPEFAAFYG